MSSSARRRAWAPPSRGLPAAALAAVLALSLPVAPGAALAAGAGTAGGMPSPLPPSSVQGQSSVRGEVVGDGEGLRIVLDSVSPVVVRPGRAATLSGRVINDSTAAVRLSDVTLSASTSLLGSRKEVADWVEGGIDRTTSWVLGDDTVGPLVPAEGEVDFAVTVAGSALEPLPDGPAALAVRISAGVDGDAAPSAGEDESGPVAELRTVLTSSDGDAVDVPLQTAWVVPLTLPPDPDLVNPDPAAHAAAWTAAVGAGSAARTWLDHLRLPDVTWLVDPSLLVAPRPEESVASATPEEGVEGEEEGEGEVESEGEGEGDEEGDGPGATGDTDDPGTTPSTTGDTDDPSTTGDTSDPGTTPSTTGDTTDPGTTPSTTGDTTGTRSVQDGAASPSPVPAPTPSSPGGDGATGTSTPGDGSLGPVPVPPPDGAPGTEPNPSDDGEGPGEEVPAADDVELALTELRDLLADVPDDGLWWLPTGDPDLARLAGEDAPPQDRVDELLTRSPEATEVPDGVTRLLDTGRSQVLWPAMANPTSDDLARIVSLFPEAEGTTSAPEVVVVPRDSFTANSAAGPRRGAVPVSGADAVALGADSWTTALVAGSATEAVDRGAAAATQHLLAHTLGTWLESPTAPRELVLAPPRGTTPPPEVLDQLSRGWSDAGWLTSVHAEGLLDRADQGDSVTLSGTPPQDTVLGERTSLLVPADSPVDATRERLVLALADDLDGLSEILTDTDALRSWTPALAGLWSTRWRQDPQAWPITYRTLRADVARARESVHVAASNVNFIADQGTVHLTVVNDLPIGVEGVQLRVTTDNGRLQVLRQPDPVSIGPGSRASIPFDARAITRGEVILAAELATPGGTELGVDQEISVRVQPTGVWIYWVLGGLAGVILVLGLARALRGGSPRVPGAAGTGGSAYPDPDPGPTPGAREEAPQ